MLPGFGGLRCTLHTPLMEPRFSSAATVDPEGMMGVSFRRLGHPPSCSTSTSVKKVITWGGWSGSGVRRSGGAGHQGGGRGRGWAVYISLIVEATPPA